MSKQKHETAFPSWYIAFQQAALAALPRPPQITKDIALAWADNGELFRQELSLIAAKFPAPLILNLISGKESIIIDAVDGSETLAQAKDVFTGYVDPDFKNYGTDRIGQATEKIPVNVYEMAKDATFAQAFSSLGNNLDRLCLSQHQIKQFCRQHRQWLRTDGYTTFFLFKENNEFFVASVRVESRGLGAGVRRFGRGSVWGADARHRLVAPQLQKL